VSVDLYERYKDALGRGHAAIARGQLDAALAAYHEALSLAPDRALPHAGVGQVLLRMGRAAEALAAFDAALDRSPRNEIGLRGRADALARLGRRTDAAAALDILSDAQEAAGHLGDACDTTRRALDLAEQKARRRRLQDLTRRLRLQVGDQETDVALARSLPPLAATDGPRQAAGASPAKPTAAGSTAMPAGVDATEAETPWTEPPAEPPEAEAAPPLEAAPPTDAAQPAGAATPPIAAPSSAPASRPDPTALVRAAEAALDAGDLTSARQAYLDAAAFFQVDGLMAAALDACTSVLAFAPDDASVHLRLVELYLEQGWSAPAADKLALLGRLTELDDQQGDARARIVVLAADHFPDDPRLGKLSAQRRDRR